MALHTHRVPRATLRKPAAKRKFARVMREFKAGTLRSGGTGNIVRDEDVAQAIAARESEKAVRASEKRKRA